MRAVADVAGGGGRRQWGLESAGGKEWRAEGQHLSTGEEGEKGRGGGSGPLALGGEMRGGPDGAGATCGGPGGQQRRWGSGRRGCGRGGDVLWSGGVR
jgi:hypothetical protein